MAELALPISDNPDIKKLLDLMQSPDYESERQGFLSILKYTDTLTEQYNNLVTKFDSLDEKFSDLTGKKNPISVMVEHLDNIITGIGEKLKALKDSIFEFTHNTLDAVKDNSLSAVGAIAGTLHIHEGLEAISKGLGSAAAKVENLENFHMERVESKLLTEFEIPSDLASLSQDELKTVYAELLEIGMYEDLSSRENAIVQDLIEEVESMLPERSNDFEQPQELELEAEQGEEI
jgi:hypothetical protein